MAEGRTFEKSSFRGPKTPVFGAVDPTASGCRLLDDRGGGISDYCINADYISDDYISDDYISDDYISDGYISDGYISEDYHLGHRVPGAVGPAKESGNQPAQLGMVKSDNIYIHI